MKNYNVELSLENWEKLRVYLIENDISFEPSACFDLIHVEIFCNDIQAAGISNYLEMI